MTFLAWFVSRSPLEHLGRAIFALVPSLMVAGFIFSFLKYGELFAGLMGALLAIPFLGVLPQDEGGVVWLDVRPMALFIGAILFYILSVRDFKKNQPSNTSGDE